MEFLLSIDKALFLFFNKSVANPVFDVVMPFITNKYNFFIPIGLLVLYLLIFGGTKGRIAVLLAVIIVTMSDQISSFVIKPLVHRLRPCNPKALVEGGRFLLGYKKSFSFTSSHAANMAAMATLFSFKYPKLKTIFITIASLVAYSRIYVGVHYPADILGGIITGMFCALLVLFVEKKVRELWRTKITTDKNETTENL